MDYYSKGEERFGPISSKIYSFGSKRPLKSFYIFIANDVKKLKPKTILDVGAGPGELAILLNKTIKNAKIYCVDPSTSMQKIARKKFNAFGVNNEYLLGSSRSIPLKKKFDIILTSISFHHWKEKEKSIKYLLKKLNKNGYLRIYEFYYDNLNRLQKVTMGKHSLSLKEAKSYSFKGYDKKVILHGNIIVMSFKKADKSINNNY